MANTPADRIRKMINELERGARNLTKDLRKRAGSVTSGRELEQAVSQLMHGLASVAVQLEKAAGELRRYIESNAPKSGGKARGKKKAAKKKATKRKAGKRKVAKKKATKKKATKKKAGKKKSSKKKAAR